MDYPIISAVLTLFNSHLTTPAPVAFFPSYPLAQIRSEAKVGVDKEQQMGVSLHEAPFVVVPVYINEAHWALAVYDRVDRRIWRLDSYGDMMDVSDVERLRRLLTARGRTRSGPLKVQQQQDVLSCGLFILCFAVYILGHPTDWKATISTVTFDIEAMRAWLTRIKTSYRSFTMADLPSICCRPLSVAAPPPSSGESGDLLQSGKRVRMLDGQYAEVLNRDAAFCTVIRDDGEKKNGVAVVSLRPVRKASAVVAFYGSSERTFLWRWFSRIRGNDVLICWDDGEESWRSLSSLKKEIVGSGSDWLSEQEWVRWCSWAIRNEDSEEVQVQKRRDRQLHWENNPQGEELPRRSARRHQSSLAGAASSSCLQPTLLQKRKRKSSAKVAECSLVSAPTQHCPSCGKLSPGELCATDGCGYYLCARCQGDNWTHCHLHGGPKLVTGLEVIRYGAIRAAPVRVQLVTQDNSLQRYASTVEELVSDSRSAVDIIVFQHHSSGVSSEEHVQRLTQGIGGRSPAFALVLTCWTDEAAQTESLRAVALSHPNTMFVSFRDPRLFLDRFPFAMDQLCHAVLFPRARPLFFLAELCGKWPETIIFAHCGSSKGDASLCGPLQVAIASPALPRCSGCKQLYPGSGRARWKKGVSGVRRRV